MKYVSRQSVSSEGTDSWEIPKSLENTEQMSFDSKTATPCDVSIDSGKARLQLLRIPFNRPMPISKQLDTIYSVKKSNEW